MILEICANSFESARAAQMAGAHRIELCTELSVGGLTPSIGLIRKVIEELTIPVHVLIRPRSGNFTYSDAELDVMLKDIQQSAQMGVTGIVSGVLTPDNRIDFEGTSKLKEAGKDLEFTFHRAFDWCKDPMKELHVLRQLGVTRLLSSGQKALAEDGIEMLKEFRKKCEDTVEIMPGGGINIFNVMEFKRGGFTSIHCSASEKIQTLSEPPKISMHGLLEEGVVSVSSFKKIQQILLKIS